LHGTTPAKVQEPEEKIAKRVKYVKKRPRKTAEEYRKKI